MKIAINNCYGGFSLSITGLRRYAELKGKTAYFFKGYGDYIPIPHEEEEEAGIFFTAFDTPDLELISGKEGNDHYIPSRPENRTDPDLIKVIEELGSENASGGCAKLKIVEIPDGVQWEIDEYDGIETIHEVHRSWS